MRKESQPCHQLSDGSWDFGNGVISASLSDRNHFNSLPETRKGKTNRLILPVTTAILGSIGLACSGGGNKNTVENTRELEKESSGYALPFPEGETWFLTTGPHGDGYSKGIKYAIDIAPPEGGFCPTDGRKFTIDNRVVTASASGEVIAKGDDKNRNDPFHSVVDIKDKNGLTQRYIHLDNIKVKSGKKIKQGDRLGNPSCEFPPGGANTGPHVHIGLMKDGQAIPIDGVKIGGWTIHNGADDKDGTMTKDGEKTRTANVGRYADPNGAMRNDLPNNSNKAVVALPKDPIPPISGSIKEKSVSAPPTPTAIPTPKPTETPKPAATETKKSAAAEREPKSLEDQAKLLALNNFLHPLSKTQEAEVDYFGFGNKSLVTLDSKIVQDMSASKTDIMQGKQSQGSDRLLVRWNTSVLGKWGTSRNLGEAEIKGMQMQVVSQPITRAEQANGIQWKGTVQINYLTHWRFVLPFFSDGRGYSGAKREWKIANPQIPAGLPFSPWAEQRWPDTLTLANGRWTSSNDQPANKTDKRVLYPLDVSTVAGGERSSPCKSIFGGGSIPGCLELQLGPRPEITFKDYSSRTLPYKLSYPEDWTADTKTTSDKVIESFTSPHDPQEQVKIVRQLVKPGTTTGEYSKTAATELCELWGCSKTDIKDSFISAFNSGKPYFISFKGTDSSFFFLIARQPGRRLNSGGAYAFVKNGYGWIVLTSEDSDQSGASEETANKIRDSFKFTQ